MLKKLTALLLVLAALTGSAAAESLPLSPKEDILEAMDVFSWFVANPLDIDPTHPAPDGSGYLLLDEELCQESAMRERLSQYFSAEICDALWDWGMYHPCDGLLYGTPIEENPLARPIDPMISEVDYEPFSQTEDKIIYTVTVHYLTENPEGYSESIDFVKERVDGQWVFTSFSYFW